MNKIFKYHIDDSAAMKALQGIQPVQTTIRLIPDARILRADFRGNALILWVLSEVDASGGRHDDREILLIADDVAIPEKRTGVSFDYIASAHHAAGVDINIFE